MAQGWPVVSGFLLRKLYADLVTPDGQVVVVYLGWLSVAGLRTAYAAIESYLPDGTRQVIRGRPDAAQPRRAYVPAGAPRRAAHLAPGRPADQPARALARCGAVRAGQRLVGRSNNARALRLRVLRLGAAAPAAPDARAAPAAVGADTPARPHDCLQHGRPRQRRAVDPAGGVDGSWGAGGTDR